MIKYQRLHVGGSNIGQPGDLPDELVGLEDVSLADLSWAAISLGYFGQGFVPVEVVEPTPPTPPVTEVTPLGFRGLFTQAERMAIRAAAKVNPLVEDWLDLSNIAQTIRLTIPVTIVGVQTLEAAGIIAPGRAAVILSGVEPS